MASVITPRTGAAVDGIAVPGSGSGIYLTSNAAGVDAYTCDVYPDISTYVADRLYLFRPPYQNTGPCSIDISGVGARGWRKPDASVFASGEVSPNLDYLLRDNGTYLITVTPSF